MGNSDKELGGLFAFINDDDDLIGNEVKKVFDDNDFDYDEVECISGTVARYEANIRAIKLLGENKDQYTREDLKILSAYSGWGGIAEAFNLNSNDAWAKRAKELLELLEEQDYIKARAGVLDAFYTPDNIINMMWDLVIHLGFEAGECLEPSCGTGRFIALMPPILKQTSSWEAVEIDNISSRVAKALYPSVYIHSKGFEEVSIEDKKALIIGNPPYGSFRISDQERGFSGLSVHNYFIRRALDELLIGGILVYVVSSSFLDNLNPSFAKEILEFNNFLGAIRLPSDTFSDTGTRVTTDIVVFQKRAIINKDPMLDIANKGTVGDNKVAEYFLDNPKRVIGEMREGFRGVEVVYSGSNSQREEDLKSAINLFPKNIVSASKKINKEKAFNTPRDCNVVWVENGFAFVNIKKSNSLQTVLLATKKRDVERIEALIELKEIVLSILENEKNQNLDEANIIRDELNKKYDVFVLKYGYVSKASNMNHFKYDKNSELIMSLEKNYDKGVSKAMSIKNGEPQRAEKAEKNSIFVKKTECNSKKVIIGNTKEALLLSLTEKGRVDIDYISSLVNKTYDEVIYELRGEIFYDEMLEDWVERSIFLSGDILSKLEYTQDPLSIKALEEVKPARLEAKDIIPSIGSSWISKEIIKDFADEVLGFLSVDIHFSTYNSKWFVSGYGSQKYYTDRRDAAKILEAALNGTYIRVLDKDSTGKLHLNIEQTEEANSKKEMLADDFLRWVYTDSARREELVNIYNDSFNRYVPFKDNNIVNNYKVQGLSDSFIPRPHQVRATYKAIFSKEACIFNHKVGSGKTLNAQMVAMELKRLGKAKKPLIVTLKAVIADFVRDFKIAYPDANILYPNENDFTRSKRAMLFSKIAMGDYDAIVLTHEQLGMIENPIEYTEKVYKEEIEDAIRSKELANQSKSGKREVKDMENIIKNLKYKMELLKSRKDDLLSFDMLGIDALIVDESHYFKKLHYVSSLGRIAGMPDRVGSKRAHDLYLKVKYIMDKNKNKNVVFLSGTVITNTIVELYLMQKFLQEDELKRQGLKSFDAWAKNYAVISTDIEITSSGKFAEKSRMSQFQNIDTLMSMFGNILDTVTNEDIVASCDDFRLPKLKGGKPTLVFSDPSDDQIRYVGKPDKEGHYEEGCLVWRSENMPTDGSDNHLKLFTDAGKCAIDMRLIDDELYSDTEGSKINRVVEESYKKYLAFDKVLGTQIIFCDTGIPKSSSDVLELEVLIEKADKGDSEAIKKLDEYSEDEISFLLSKSSFSVYNDIKKKLILKGVGSDEIAFIHDFKSKKQKEELSLKMQSGDIRILIGSTKKAGTGINVQKRIVAVHHIDIPHMPSDLEQRNGRIIRQGNMLIDEVENFEIEIFYYATRKTLDGVKWQTIERKAKFIEEFMRGSVSEECGDLEQSTSELSEIMKAEASGNHLLLDKVRIDKELKKLNRLKTSFLLEVEEKKEKIEKLNHIVPLAESQITLMKETLKSLDNEPLVLFDEVVTSFNEDVLTKKIKKVVLEAEHTQKEYIIGMIGAVEIKVAPNVFDVYLELIGVGGVRFSKKYKYTTAGFYFMKFIKGIYSFIEFEISKKVDEHIINKHTLDRLKESELNMEFPQDDKIAELEKKKEAIIEAMKPKEKDDKDEDKKAS